MIPNPPHSKISETPVFIWKAEIHQYAKPPRAKLIAIINRKSSQGIICINELPIFFAVKNNCKTAARNVVETVAIAGPIIPKALYKTKFRIKLLIIHIIFVYIIILVLPKAVKIIPKYVNRHSSIQE